MLNKNPIIKVINQFIFPFLVFFALYIQLNAEIAPGGGFQAGTIFASSLIAISLIKPNILTNKALIPGLRIIASTGTLIFLTTGLVALLSNGQYLDYSYLAANAITGQKIGITIIELGVGLTVSSAMLLIYFLFDQGE
jgi:multicomponent Na+:H+ antiporter subunit B